MPCSQTNPERRLVMPATEPGTVRARLTRAALSRVRVRHRGALIERAGRVACCGAHGHGVPAAAAGRASCFRRPWRRIPRAAHCCRRNARATGVTRGVGHSRYCMISTPHDRLFKVTFSQPQHAAELLRSVLPAAAVRHIAWDTLQVDPVSFIDEKLRARFSDLLFRVRLAGQPAYLYLLFEHQSGPERMMCPRLLRYVNDVWSEHLKKHPRARHVPVVIPVVLHHGEDGWGEPVSLRELYDAPAAVLDGLRPYIPELTFVLDDLVPLSEAALRARALSAIPRLVLWALAHVRHGRDVVPALRKSLHLVRAVLRAPNGLAALLTVLRYIVDVSDSSEQEILNVLERGMLPDAREALMTIAERLRREGIQKGHKEGRKEGRKEGHQKGIKEGREAQQRESLLKLLNGRFGPLTEQVLERIHRARLAQLDRWFERGITARSLDAVFANDP
jgi:predicted transposase YdaD